jgi:hypothetical protein
MRECPYPRTSLQYTGCRALIVFGHYPSRASTLFDWHPVRATGRPSMTASPVTGKTNLTRRVSDCSLRGDRSNTEAPVEDPADYLHTCIILHRLPKTLICTIGRFL